MGPRAGRTVTRTVAFLPSLERTTCAVPGESAVTTPSAETLATVGWRLEPETSRPARIRPWSSRASAKSCAVSPTRSSVAVGMTATEDTGAVEWMGSPVPQAQRSSEAPRTQWRSMAARSYTTSRRGGGQRSTCREWARRMCAWANRRRAHYARAAFTRSSNSIY